jgi:hypothetical protein
VPAAWTFREGARGELSPAEHRLEAYATLTPSRRHFRCTAIAPRDGSERSLDSPERQWSIGFQPVFCSHVERCSTFLARLNCALYFGGRWLLFAIFCLSKPLYPRRLHRPNKETKTSLNSVVPNRISVAPGSTSMRPALCAT